MPARTFLICAAVLIASCATAQENPNYTFSSKYGDATTQLASAQPAPMPVQTVQVQSTQTGPQSITAAHPQVLSTSPTEQVYDADRMVGTPGYEAMRAQQVQSAEPVYAQPQSLTPQPPTVQTVPQTPPQTMVPREISYDYAQNLSGNEAAPVPALPTPAYPVTPATGLTANIPTQQSYIVQPGDTVYSLSRRLCAPITEIMTANGIGGDFAISIGQALTLPQSRC